MTVSTRALIAPIDLKEHIKRTDGVRGDIVPECAAPIGASPHTHTHFNLRFASSRFPEG
ncbi:MAG: hypothetical protein HC865_10660 [Cyanobacteria bacterium RU_5_0]|nr:hypothetical protein [Cyanobacteria bacterium RU_5_0]